MDGDERALELALRQLSRRDRTEAELRRYLAGKEVAEPAADAAVAELRRMGYLDDARYARTFAEDRRSLDGWGAERIERRLLALGVDRGLVAEAVGARDGAGELQAAVELLRRRWRRAPVGDRERERALAMLVRKGYDLELAYYAVRAFERTTAA
ncbi:MAG TPA: RecX family transcriptional regulator [Solirubrobacteraceae bacterium]|nr:RecX family transcriptional regulator [Solirubrobacteraceae bacterium]